MRFLDTTDTKFMKIRFQTFKKRSDALKSRSRIKNNKRYTFIALLKKERARREMTEVEEEEEETMAPTPTPLSSNTPPLPSPSTTTTKAGKEQPKPRLVIKSMVLENFKSYAGAQHVGPFHKVSTSFLESSFVGQSSF
jgi:structural maintenance of chromosome 4